MHLLINKKEVILLLYQQIWKDFYKILLSGKTMQINKIGSHILKKHGLKIFTHEFAVFIGTCVYVFT